MVTNKLFRNIARKTAPYLAAITMALPISCSRDITSPKYEEPVQTVEQFSQKYQPLIQSGNYSLEEMLSEAEELSYQQPKQKSSSQTKLSAATYTDGNVNNSERTDIFDLLDLLKALGGNVNPNYKYDIDNNNKTDVFDLLCLLKILGGVPLDKYKVYGKVKGIHAGNPEYSTVPNAIVSFKDKNWNPVVSVKSDANGNYSAYLKEGDYFMCVSADDFHNYPYFEDKNPYVKWYYFDTEVKSNLQKDGVILNKDVDIEFFGKVLKSEDVNVNPHVGVPVAKPEKNPKIWVQENTTTNPYTNASQAKPTAENVAVSDIPNFQREFIPVLTDSSNAKFRSFFVPDGHPMIGNSAWARYIPEVDWNTNTVTGGTIWYFDALGNTEFSKGVYREEISQVMMGLGDTFNPAYSTTTLYHDSQIAKDFTQLDEDNIGKIYHLVPKGF